jgi:hypothetical protein
MIKKYYLEREKECKWYEEHRSWEIPAWIGMLIRNDDCIVVGEGLILTNDSDFTTVQTEKWYLVDMSSRLIPVDGVNPHIIIVK